MEPGNQPISNAQLPKATITSTEELKRQRRILIIIIAVAVLILILSIVSFLFLINPSTNTAQIRDVFIIFMSLEMMFLGLIMVILIIQLARLINLLQNEITPILDSTNETINNLRGTTMFLSENIVEPVIKMNEYSAGIRQGLIILGLLRRKNNK
jgi:hypothetical protein